jgi:Domain of unknown function DUF29
MPDDLYDRDILEWSERQAAALRHLTSDGKPSDGKHGDVDWLHVIEEIQGVGTAQLNDVRGIIRQAMMTLVGIHLDWKNVTRPDRLLELDCLLDDAGEQFTPSMKQRIDLNTMWHRLRERTIRYSSDDPRCHALPDHCPWTLEALLANDHDALLAALAGWPVAPATPTLL